MSLILSLDIKNKELAKQITKDTLKHTSCIKIGHILSPYLSYDDINKDLCDKDIFLDFKLFDIPNTVFEGVKSYEEKIKNLKYITIHGIAEDEMILKSLKASKKATILSVISLTSSTLDKSLFLKQAERNIKLGVKGFICPVSMLKNMRKNFGENIELISPGVRNQSDNNDHKEFASSSFAYSQGASHIVVGRPIINAKDPKIEALKYLK